MKRTIRLDPILCPVVPTDGPDEGLRCAIALARARNAKLFVLSCVDGSLSRLEARASIKTSIERSVDLHKISVETAPLDWEPIVVEGSHPAEVITREAVERKVGLIVMSSRHRPYAAALLGSTAEKVSRTARCPVLVTRFEGDRSAKLTHSIEFKRLLVASDFSRDSELTLRYGLSLAQEYQSDLHLLHVLADSPTSGEEINWNSPEGPYHEAARRLHQSIPAEAHLWCRVTHAVREGKPYREILSYAAEHKIDLICIGAHGKGSQFGGLFGSNADRVLRESPCPVLVLRAPKYQIASITSIKGLNEVGVTSGSKEARYGSFGAESSGYVRVLE
jgi:nucleotide-binding universal stress UspA family protein